MGKQAKTLWSLGYGSEAFMHMSGVVTSCHITKVPHTVKCICIVKNMSVCDVDITLAVSNPDHITKYATSRDKIMQKHNRARQPFCGLLHVPFFSDAVPPFLNLTLKIWISLLIPCSKIKKLAKEVALNHLGPTIKRNVLAYWTE